MDRGPAQANSSTESLPETSPAASAPKARRWSPATLLQLPRLLWDRSRLVQTLKRDRLLAIATLVMVAVTLSPLFVTPFLPLADLPDHTAQGALLPDILFKRGIAAYFYKIQWAPVPYWTTHLIIAVLSPIVGGLWAAKIMVGMAVVAMPLAAMRMLVALGRDPRLGLLAFLVGWDHNVYAGWIAFSLGMSAALWGVAWTLEARTPKEALKVTALACYLGLTHVQAVGYFGLVVASLVLVRRPFLQALKVHVIACAGLGISVVPWLANRFSASAKSGVTAWAFEFHSLRDKLNAFFGFTLDNQPGTEFNAMVTGAAFLVLLLGPALLACVPQEPADANDAPPASSALLVLVPLVMYLTLPMSISGPVAHWYTYPRYATIALLSLLFMPRARFTGTRLWWLLPGVLVAFLYNVRVATQFADYAQRGRAFLKIIEHVKPNSSYLPLELEDADPAMQLAPYNQIHAYIAAVKKGYDPHLFDYDSIPFRFRQDRRLPQTPWNAPQTFNLRDHGQYYDYVVVQGLARDPLVRLKPMPGVRAKLVVESGRFRLYAIEKDSP